MNNEIEKTAYMKVVKYCLQLQKKADVIPMSILTKMVRDTFTEINEIVTNSIKKNLRRRI